MASARVDGEWGCLAPTYGYPGDRAGGRLPGRVLCTLHRVRSTAYTSLHSQGTAFHADVTLPPRRRRRDDLAGRLAAGRSTALLERRRAGVPTTRCTTGPERT